MTSNHRLSLLVVGVITVSCCTLTAAVTLAIVVVVIRHRRRHHVTSHNHRCAEKSATATPLIASSFHLSPTTHLHHHQRLHQSAPRLLPDVAKCESDAEEHQYDVLETGSTAYYWPGGGGGGGGRRVLVSGGCRCSSCLLASSRGGSRLQCDAVNRQTASDKC